MEIPKAFPVPVDGRVIRVPRDVFQEVMKTHTLDQVNALPYDDRMKLVNAATARIEERRKAGDPSAIAAQLREERRRRKSEAWEKRQPKTKGASTNHTSGGGDA